MNLDRSIAGCGSAIMEAHLARASDPLRTLRHIESEGAHPTRHVHYAAAMTATIRRALAEFAAGSEIETVGDGAYRIAVTIAGRVHLVTVEPAPMRASPLAVAA